MIKVDENDPIGELEPSFPYRDVQIKWNVDVKQYYELQSEIGRGKFGTVYKCKEKETGLSLAAKFVAIARRQDRRNVEREVEIMRELQHPRLIQIYDAFESSNVMCVVLELIEGGELFERVIDDDFVLTEKSCTVFMRQICEAVEFIHSKDILHLDMKPENILCLTKTGNRIKIIDFGLARKFDPGKKLQVLFGTPEFVAPEVVNFDQIGFGTDMWSVGVICYVLLSGLSPFMGETDVATMANVTIALYDFDDDAFSSISEDARDFIRKLLVKDKDARLTATQCLQHPWLRRKQPLPKPKVEQLESTKDNLRSFVDRWGDGTSPVPFIVQSPNNVKEIETGEPKLPSGMTPPDHIKPSVVIPKDVQIKIDALSPTSPHSPLPKKIKLQDEAGSESAKTKTGKKSDSKPKNGSIKKSKTLATDKESTQKNNEKGKESVNDISKCDSYSTQRKNSDHNCLVTPEPKLIAKSSPKLERNVDAESVDNQLEKSHDIENKLPTPQSLGPAKTDCDKNLSKNNLITIFNNSRNIKPGGGNECGKNEEISNSASSNSISTQQLGVRDALLTNRNDAAQGSSNLTSVLSKDTSKPSTNGVGYQKDLSNQTPDSPSMNAKVEATLPPPNTNIALKNETTLHQSNETEPHQKQTPASVILPTIQNKTNQQSEAKILTDASSTSAISSLPRINIIPIKVEKSDSSPLGGKTTIGRGSEVEGNNAHLEDKPKKVSNISGLKSIWGSKISANESKSTGHPIVKYNRTLSSPTPNTAKSRTTISQRQNKLEENEVTTSQTASTLNPVKVVLHRIEVDNNHSGAQNTKMLPNQKANSTETRLKINLDSCRNQNSNNSSFNDTKYTNNNYLSLNSNSSNDTSKKSPINEWVNEKLLNDRFKIDRRASDISSLVDKDSFYGDSVDMMGSRIAEEISKITDKFCRINDESDSGNGRGMLLGKPPANVQQIQQDRHDKITDLLNGKRRPKYRRLTYMNRDVPLGSTPPPTNLTYYLTNLNSTNPLWAANFEVPSCNFFSAPGTPIGSPRSPTETSLDHDIIFQMLSDKLKEVESNISAKKANMVNT